MTIRPNPAGLRIVEASAPSSADLSVLLVGDKGSQRVHAEERDVETPEISLALHEHFEGTGRVVAVEGGVLAEVQFSLLWRGQKRTVVGVAVASLTGADVVLPRGALAKLDSGRAAYYRQL